ncbi:RNI-like protein [Xylariomycetidae sp. FL0641]|nr:RNI-like protein [Xylariomycetidae sp. FL0641]
MRPPAPSLDVIAARNSRNGNAATPSAAAVVAAEAAASESSNALAPPAGAMATDSRDSRSSSSTNSPVPADNEESDFFLTNNDSQSSLGVVPNMQDMQVTDPDCLPTVAALPSEILINIFSHIHTPTELLNCMLTCKRWARNVVEILWHRPTCTTWEKHASICHTLQMDRPFFTYTEFIKRLNLANLAKDVSDGSVMPLAVCTRVERLTLTGCKALTDHGLIPLVVSNQNLLALDISGDVNITEASIMAIAQSCRRLQGLNISNCKQISNESLIQLAENCRFIKRLKLNDCNQLSDAAVTAFANGCPNILEIDLHQCANITNEPVTALLAKGQSLRELRLAGCDLIDDGAFLTLPYNKTYEHLRILDLTSCVRLTDRAVKKIVDVAPRLRNLVLAKCTSLTDSAVYAISQLGKNLHYVHLGHCRQITDDAVKQLVQSCNRIRYIDLGCCNLLTDESVTRLATLPKLRRIGLVKCVQITDASMYALARANNRPRERRDLSRTGTSYDNRSSSLERVHLSYCNNLTLPSIIKLLNSCPNLTHLSLTGVPAFMRDDLEPFCREAPDDFTDHQRAVFCVFSGAGVKNLRRYVNTRDEFAEYHDVRYQPRTRVVGPTNWPAIGAPGISPDLDGFDDGADAEDDDIGDGSETAVENGNLGPHEAPGPVQVQLPPSVHLPPALPTPGLLYSHAASPTHSPTIAPQVLPNDGQTPSPSTSLEGIAVDHPAPGVQGPSTAGSGLGLFGASTSTAGPSTASMQAPMEDED